MSDTKLDNIIQFQSLGLERAEGNSDFLTIAQEITGGTVEPAHYSYESDYDRLHMQLPFLEINPIVGAVNLLFIASSATSETMPIPDGAQLMRFKSVQNFYVGYQSLTAISGDIVDGSAPMLNPEGWYFCKNRKSVSVLSTANNQVVTAEFFIQL